MGIAGVTKRMRGLLAAWRNRSLQRKWARFAAKLKAHREQDRRQYGVLDDSTPYIREERTRRG